MIAWTCGRRRRLRESRFDGEGRRKLSSYMKKTKGGEGSGRDEGRDDGFVQRQNGQLRKLGANVGGGDDERIWAEGASVTCEVPADHTSLKSYNSSLPVEELGSSSGGLLSHSSLRRPGRQQRGSFLIPAQSARKLLEAACHRLVSRGGIDGGCSSAADPRHHVVSAGVIASVLGSLLARKVDTTSRTPAAAPASSPLVTSPSNDHITVSSTGLSGDSGDSGGSGLSSRIASSYEEKPKLKPKPDLELKLKLSPGVSVIQMLFNDVSRSGWKLVEGAQVI